MATSSETRARRGRRPFVWIAGIAVVLFLALTIAWYVLANRLDGAVREAIEAAAGSGTRIECDGQEVFGYPFRLGLHCNAVGVEVPEQAVRASAGPLRTAAQIYDPSKIVAELGSPLLIEAPGAPPLDIRWRLAQGSAHFWTEGLDRLAIVVEAPVVALAEPAGAARQVASSDHLEIHARRRDGDLDVAVSDLGVKALGAAFEGLPTFDFGLDLTVAGAGDWLSGRRPGDTFGQALRGRSGTLRSLTLAAAAPATGGAEVSGPFSVNEAGEISGAFDLAVTDPQALAALVTRLVPEAASVAGLAASGIGLAGRTENGRTTIRVTVENGEASFAMFRLGRIPPLE